MKTLVILSALLASPFAMALSPAEVLRQKDAYSFDVLNRPRFKAAIESALTSEIQADMETSSPAVIADKRFLVLDGCEPHNCGDNHTLIAIDSKNPKAILVVRIQTNDAAAADQNQENIVYIRNKAWKQTVEERNFPELLKRPCPSIS